MFKSNEEIPRSAFDLYKQFYIRKYKDKTDSQHKNVSMQATKSWLALTDVERTNIITKLQECHDKYRNTFADYLKNTQPFLKRKKCTRERYREDEVVTNPEDTDDVIYTSDNRMEDSQLFIAEPERNEELSDVECVDQSYHETQPLTEPDPPKVKSGKELYEMMKSTNSDNNKLWLELPKPVQRKYQKAVSTIKKSYIQKYKEYLESLSSEELYAQYIKNVEKYLAVFLNTYHVVSVK